MYVYHYISYMLLTLKELVTFFAWSFLIWFLAAATKYFQITNQNIYVSTLAIFRNVERV